jgi:Protein of unknown function (DUF2938)
MTLTDFLFRSFVMGMAATALLDCWALLLNHLFGFGLPNWAMVGRWVAHLPAGKIRHDDISLASPVANEPTIGWIFHYAVGIVFAMATLVLGGAVWTKSPTLALPLIVGIVTVGCGWFILQPALGAGIAASRKPDASRIRLLNIAGHIVFGLGLWLAALAMSGA